jgi:hypothetical protein
MFDDGEGLTVESLLDAIDGCADWRLHTAAENPDDERHANAALALRALAAWVRANRDEPCVRAVIGVQGANSDLDLTWPISGAAGRILSQYGFALQLRPRASTFLWDLAFALTDDVDEARSRQSAD